MLEQFAPPVVPEGPGVPDYATTVSFTAARDFVLKADMLVMGADQEFSSYLGAVGARLFRNNTLFDLTESEKSWIVWRGLPQRLRSQLEPVDDQPFRFFCQAVYSLDRQQRGPRSSTPEVRDLPPAGMPRMRHDAEASSSRQHERPELAPEDTQPTTRLRVDQPQEAVLEGSSEEEDPEEPEEEEDPEEGPLSDEEPVEVVPEEDPLPGDDVLEEVHEEDPIPGGDPVDEDPEEDQILDEDAEAEQEQEHAQPLENGFLTDED